MAESLKNSEMIRLLLVVKFNVGRYTNVICKNPVFLLPTSCVSCQICIQKSNKVLHMHISRCCVFVHFCYSLYSSGLIFVVLCPNLVSSKSMFCILVECRISPNNGFGKKHLEKLTTSFSREFDGLFYGGSR